MQKATDRPNLATLGLTHLGLVLVLIFFAIDCPRIAAAYQIADKPRSLELNELTDLIGQLDSPSFHERETAMGSIMKLGPQAVPALAEFALEASPETSRRIKMCLEELSVQGSEDDLFRTMALLILLFDRDSEKMEAKVSKLRSDWVTKRSEQALRRLAELGARIERAPNEREQLFNGLILSSRNDLREPKKNRVVKQRAKKLSPAEMKEELGEILIASVEENRKRVFGVAPAQLEEQEVLNSTLLGGQQAILMEGRLVMVDAGVVNVGTTVAIGDGWRGSAAEFELLEQVEDLTDLRLKEIAIDQKIVSLMKRLRDLRTLSLYRCEIEATEFGVGSLPRQLSTLEFVNTEIDRSLVERLSKLSLVRNLQFEACTFASDALGYFAEQDPVAMLSFRKMKLDNSFFRNLAKTDKLNYLVLSGCKFDVAEFEDLTRSRRDLRVELIPMAFLGVQSDIVGYDQDLGCIISSVVAGSAAAEAGVRVNDRIASLDGHSISRFEDLKTRISQYVPGEEIELNIERNGRKSTLKAKLRGVDERPRF